MLRSLALFLVFASVAEAQQTGARPGVLLEDLTWQQAEKVLTRQTVVVIPLGAGAKEHGPHLKLSNDFIMAEYLKRRVVESADVVAAPTVNYNFYPAFLSYPGSTSLNTETARDMIVQICRSSPRMGRASSTCSTRASARWCRCVKRRQFYRLTASRCASPTSACCSRTWKSRCRNRKAARTPTIVT